VNVITKVLKNLAQEVLPDNPSSAHVAAEKGDCKAEILHAVKNISVGATYVDLLVERKREKGGTSLGRECV
jgi:hypothetical protein